ncbi:MAG: enoyl-CoA hydratase-related protein [bacterium]|nr:enoyl-CoA hydratase-related protein [bacterium]
MNTVLISTDGPVGIVSMNRPTKRNALSVELVSDLRRAFEAFASNNDVRVIVLKGEGTSFCSGADLDSLQRIADASAMENLADSTHLMQMMQSVVECPKPVIAQVHGPAIAGGCGLASVCDVVVAGRNGALFGYSEVRIGFIPAIVLVYLMQKVGDARARRLVLSGATISAEEAFRIGLVSDVVEDDNLDLYVSDLAATMAKNSGTAMALTKQMLNALHGMSSDAALKYATSMNALARQTDDCKAGIARFLNSNKG